VRRNLHRRAARQHNVHATLQTVPARFGEEEREGVARAAGFSCTQASASEGQARAASSSRCADT
jgi:hypothetical protein